MVLIELNVRIVTIVVMILSESIVFVMFTITRLIFNITK